MTYGENQIRNAPDKHSRKMLRTSIKKTNFGVFFLFYVLLVAIRYRKDSVDNLYRLLTKVENHNNSHNTCLKRRAT